jgi:hypothetical protein
MSATSRNAQAKPIFERAYLSMMGKKTPPREEPHVTMLMAYARFFRNQWPTTASEGGSLKMSHWTFAVRSINITYKREHPIPNKTPWKSKTWAGWCCCENEVNTSEMTVRKDPNITRTYAKKRVWFKGREIFFMAFHTRDPYASKIRPVMGDKAYMKKSWMEPIKEIVDGDELERSSCA